jgi:hypothetical protein
MDVITHPAVTMDPMPKLPHPLCHQRLKVFPVIIRKENALTAVGNAADRLSCVD